jgi:prolipoprotein diacylglyceryltransferase
MDVRSALLVHTALEMIAIGVGVRLYARNLGLGGNASLLRGAGFTLVLGCLLGAIAGSKLAVWMEYPHLVRLYWGSPLLVLTGQSIVGGLIGGLIGVEIAKKVAGIRRATGDDFVLPLVAGMVIGRIGCFLAGLHDDTYGVATELPWGVDFGDGVKRHPTQLYDIVVVGARVGSSRARGPGSRASRARIQLFLAGYLVWRFVIDGFKPVPLYAYPGPEWHPNCRCRGFHGYAPLVARQLQARMTRKTRPYLFYDTTTSVCDDCLRPVEAKILFKDRRVYMDKWCPVHGTGRVLVSDDVDYYRACREIYVKAPEMPRTFNTSMQFGCPYDCGLCPDHMQHSCLTIVEINDVCNLECPICYAESGPKRTTRNRAGRRAAHARPRSSQRGRPERRADLRRRADAAPRLSPFSPKRRRDPIKHLMVNTNGIRIRPRSAFVERSCVPIFRGPRSAVRFAAGDGVKARVAPT